MRHAMVGLMVLAILAANGRGQEPKPSSGEGVDPKAQALAAALLQEKDATARSALLAREGATWSPALEQALVGRAEEREKANDSAGAMEVYEVILGLAEAAGDKRATAEALRDLGYWSAERLDYKAAIDYQSRALVLAEELGDKLGQLKSNNNLGNAYSELGNNRTALNYYQRALAVVGNSPYEVQLLTNIAGLHADQGDHAAARTVLERALEKAAATEDPYDARDPLNNLGVVYVDLGDYAKAQECFEKFLKLAEESGASQRIALALNNLGNVLREQGRFEEARGYLDRSLKLAEEIGDRQDVLLNLKDLSRLALLQRQSEKGLGFAERCSELARQYAAPSVLWQCRALVGRSNLWLGRKAPSRAGFQDAIDIIEAMRLEVAGGEEQRVRFFAEYVSPYQGMVSLLADEAPPLEALAFAERAKGRVLLEVLQHGRTDVGRAMTPAEREEERRLGRELASLNREAFAAMTGGEEVRGAGDATASVPLDKRLEKARHEYESFRMALYAAHPELRVERGDLSLPRPEELKGIIAADDALLEYVVTDEETYLFLMTRSDAEAVPALEVVKLPATEPGLRKDVSAFRRQLAERSLGYRGGARLLYDQLLKPVEGRLKGRRTLIVVPDGPLWDLPFQALVRGERHLLEDFALSYAPSLSVLAEMSRPRPPEERTRLLAMGDPAVGSLGEEALARARSFGDSALKPLPESGREVRAMGQIYGAAGSRIYTGVDAREDTWKREAPSARILHVASHGILDDQRPMYSHLLLARGGAGEGDDGLLEAREIADLDLKAELAVLSACETGRGSVGNGEGLIGMSWAFFVAGCPAAVVSHWKVDSASTTRLMVAFHKSLTAQPGVSKAEALRTASLELLRKGEFRHPFYWAGFSLVGSRAPLSNE